MAMVSGTMGAQTSLQTHGQTRAPAESTSKLVPMERKLVHVERRTTGLIVPGGELIDRMHTDGAGQLRAGQPVEIATERSTDARTLSREMHLALLSDPNILGLEASLERPFSQFALRNQYYFTAKDSALSLKPVGSSQSDELAFGQEMARTVRKYILLKGIPNFFRNRSGTKQLVRAYDQTMATVTSATSIQVKTEANWVLSTGFNPLSQAAWAHYSNEQWTFSAANNLSAPIPVLSVARGFKSWGAATSYHIAAKHLAPSVSQTWSPQLSTRIDLAVPLAAENVMAATTTTISLAYVF